MELINQTGVPAELVLTSLDDRRRAGVLIVKATLELEGGQLRLETDAPLPVLFEDQETPLGALPNDAQPPGNRPVFELMVLGAACAAQPVQQMKVELYIGDLRRSLLVSGDRHWVTQGELAAPTAPVPFTRMPLAWTHAFGGSDDVWIDDRARVPLHHAANTMGVGFHAFGAARDMLAGLSRVEPRPEDFVQALPNVEDPAAPVARPQDAPNPKCWAPLPLAHGLIPSLIAAWKGDGPAPYRPLQRAHPELTFPEAPLGQTIELVGCTVGSRFAFVLPPLGLEADYIIGGRTGTIVPRPQRMILLPDERRVLVTYYAYFTFMADPEDERSLRLRTRT